MPTKRTVKANSVQPAPQEQGQAEALITNGSEIWWERAWRWSNCIFILLFVVFLCIASLRKDWTLIACIIGLFSYIWVFMNPDQRHTNTVKRSHSTERNQDMQHQASPTIPSQQQNVLQQGNDKPNDSMKVMGQPLSQRSQSLVKESPMKRTDDEDVCKFDIDVQKGTITPSPALSKEMVKQSFLHEDWEERRAARIQRWLYELIDDPDTHKFLVLVAGHASIPIDDLDKWHLTIMPMDGQGVERYPASKRLNVGVDHDSKEQFMQKMHEEMQKAEKQMLKANDSELTVRKDG